MVIITVPVYLYICFVWIAGKGTKVLIRATPQVCTPGISAWSYGIKAIINGALLTSSIPKS
jgi:hypothetical protein